MLPYENVKFRETWLTCHNTSLKPPSPSPRNTLKTTTKSPEVNKGSKFYCLSQCGHFLPLSCLNRVKEKFTKGLTIIFVDTISDFIRLGKTSSLFVFGNSSYRFHARTAKLNWIRSRQLCKDAGSDLVSIESEKEWSFLKNAIQRMNTTEYFIGLKKDISSNEWRWISDNSKVNATKGKFPWANGEPSGNENCAVMYKDYRKYYGLFNDLSCTTQTRRGYICESPTNSTDQKGMSYKFYWFLLRLHWAICLFVCLFFK